MPNSLFDLIKKSKDPNDLRNWIPRDEYGNEIKYEQPVPQPYIIPRDQYGNEIKVDPKELIKPLKQTTMERRLNNAKGKEKTMDRMKMQGLLEMMSKMDPGSVVRPQERYLSAMQPMVDPRSVVRTNEMPMRQQIGDLYNDRQVQQQRYTYDQMMQADPSGSYISNMFRDIPNLNEIQRRELFNSLDEEQRKQAFDILFEYSQQYRR